MVSIYIVLVALLTSIFFLRMAADMLTPPAIRTFMYAKLILMILLMTMCVPLFSKLWFSTRWLNQDETLFIFFTALIMLYFFALFWGGQVNTHPQRWKGLLPHYLLGEGYTPTLIYVIVLTFYISFSVDINLSDKKALWLGLYCVSYYTFFSGLARMLRRRFLKPEKRTVLVYIMLLLVLIGFNGIITLIHWGLIGNDMSIVMTVAGTGVILALMPLGFIHSWELAHDVVGLWMLLPFLIGLFAAWLGTQTKVWTPKDIVNEHKTD